MQHILKIALVFVIAATTSLVSGAMDQATKDYILNLHNEYRTKEAKEAGAADLAKLEWDSGLEAEAASWAGGCVFKHKGMGENLAWNSMTDKPETELIDKAMKNFYDEKLRYSYGQYSCGSSCHYTQMVWAKTSKVGCASRVCEPLTGAYKKAWYLVCRYSPNGNMMGEKPYVKGGQCSKCGGAKCEDGLCVGGAKEQGGDKTKTPADGASKGDAKTEAACTDSAGMCATWAKNNQCDVNPNYMHKTCRKSCNKC